MKRFPFALAIILASALGAGALAVYVHQNPKAVTPPAAVSTAPPPAKVDASQQPVAPTVSVFVPSMGEKGITFTVSAQTVPDGRDPKEFAINQFLTASEITPPNARALGVDVRDGLAVVSFNNAFRRTYGSFDEKMLIDGICRNLGQFPGIKETEFQIDGQNLGTLGSADLSQPVPVLTSDAQANNDDNPPPSSSKAVRP